MRGEELKIKRLEIVEYPPPPSNAHWRNYTHLNPTWEQVETSIRALNHYCLPFMFIGLSEVEGNDDYLSVLGGPNGYSIDTPGKTYFDPTKTGGEIAVWTSDQGYYPKEQNVTYDIALVLKVARYFAEHGERDPSVLWR